MTDALKGIELQDDRIWVIPDEVDDKTESGLIVPESGQKPFIFGTVVKIGVGRYTEHGEVIPMSVEEDDRVRFHRHEGGEVDYEGETYRELRPHHIQLRIPAPVK